mmetsp:Transcript_3251/g.8046  ORF Transcript_3251/g.8046 Transcript_3251/m.8046 type:complete len:211 (+) Transcript_3251:275-907(+)
MLGGGLSLDSGRRLSATQPIMGSPLSLPSSPTFPFMMPPLSPVSNSASEGTTGLAPARTSCNTTESRRCSAASCRSVMRGCHHSCRSASHCGVGSVPSSCRCDRRTRPNRHIALMRMPSSRSATSSGVGRRRPTSSPAAMRCDALRRARARRLSCILTDGWRTCRPQHCSFQGLRGQFISLMPRCNVLYYGLAGAEVLVNCGRMARSSPA